MKRLCYVSRCYGAKESAGRKAKTDYEDILASMGARNLGLGRRYDGSKVRAFLRNLAGVGAYFFRVRRGHCVVLQYPVKKYFRLMCFIARMRGADTVAFIHDLGSWRRKRISEATELRRLNSSDAVIAANEAMEQWLVGHGLTVRHTAMGLHDYLGEGRPRNRAHNRPWSVTYAGSLNLRKSSFLEKLQREPGVNLFLYGNLPPEMAEMAEGATVCGNVAPEEFIENARGDFGLVWDGAQLDACTGPMGEYLRVNTPHKCSFYLRAGLPLIVWSRSAMAAEVTRLGIGIAVDTLEGLGKRLDAVSNAEYETMSRAVASVAEDLAAGRQLRRALGSIVR